MYPDVGKPPERAFKGLFGVVAHPVRFALQRTGTAAKAPKFIAKMNAMQ